MTHFPEPIEPHDEGGEGDPAFLRAFEELAERLRAGEAADEVTIDATFRNSPPL